MKYLIQSILIALVLIMQVQAQQAEISGMVTDISSGQALIGAHILLKENQNGAVSNSEGLFRMSSIEEGTYHIQVSHIGFKTVEKVINVGAGSSTILDFQLLPEAYLTEEAVITANRTEVSRNLVPITVSLVNRKALENDISANLLPVVAKQVPGVFVTERGVTGFGVADGSAGKISIRGIGGSPNTQVLVLIDGHPQFMGIFGHPLPDSYASSDAEKVEVIRGPGSILYGSNAMGGVVNIITRKPSQPGLTLQGNLAYGSFNTLKFNAGVGLSLKKFDAFFSYNKDKTDGHRDHSAFDMDNLYTKLAFKLNDHFKVSADLSLALYQSTNPGPVNTTDTTYRNPTHFQDMKRGFASVTLENKYKKADGALKAYANWGRHILDYDNFESEDVNFGLILYQALKLFKGNTITVGADVADYGGYAQSIHPEPPVKFVDTTLMETGVYALAQQEIAKKITVSAGLRLQYHELFGQVWIPQAGATWKPAERTSLRANVSKGYRSPTIRELLMFKPANPDLDPENSWNYEAGIQQWLLQNKLTMDLTLFYTKGSNLIETVGQFPDIQHRNTGYFEHYGAEFQGKYAVIRDMDLLLNYAWLHTDAPRLAAPEHLVYLQGNYQLKNLMFQISGQYVGQLVTQVSPLTEQSYLLISARVSYTLKGLLTFYIDAENLSDRAYEINYGYPMPGISLVAGIKVNRNFQF